MSDRKRRLRHLANRGKEPHWLYFLPLMLIVGFVPLIVRARVTPLTEMEQLMFNQQTAFVDVFHYHKSVWFILLTLAAGLVLAYLHYEGIRMLEKRRWMGPLAIYGVFVILSFLNSDDFVVGWRGFATSYQGLPVYLAYGGLILIFFQMVKTKRDALLFMWPLVIMSTVMVLISMSQYFARAQFDEHAFFGPIHSLFDYPWVRRLLIPEELPIVDESLRITGTVFGTLYNSNFAGSFGAMMAFAGIAFAFLAVKKSHKALALSLLPMGVFIVFASGSRAGFIGLITASGIWFILGLPHFYRQHRFAPLLVIVILGVTLFGLDRISEGIYRERIGSILEGVERQEAVQILEINLDGFDFEIISETTYVNVRWTGSQLLFFDEEENIIPFTLQGNTYLLNGESFEGFQFDLQPTQGRIRAQFHGRTLWVYFSETALVIQGVGGFLPWTENAERIEALRGYERLFSSRGYIYSVSLPLLRQSWFLGSGPDHFVLTFPQRDISGRINGFTINSVLDKPHNMFLQFAIEIGLLGTLALFSIIAWPFWKLMVAFKKPTTEGLFYVSLFAGLSGMLISGLANDLILSIAPLFFVLFGLSMTEIEEAKK